jgi:two-component system LytT family response regulator
VTERLSAVIVDDSPQARNLLRLMLNDVCPQIEVVAEAWNVDDALAAVLEHQPRIVFLDIEMPGGSGLSLPQKLSDHHTSASVIFVTAYHEHAVRAFELSALDYILKPVNPERLKQAVQRAAEQHQNNSMIQRLQALEENLTPARVNIVAIHSMRGTEFVQAADILYLKAEGAYTRLVCTGVREVLASKNLSHFEKMLGGDSRFFRAHRSYLVNTQHVIASTKDGLQLLNAETIPLSRDKRKDMPGMDIRS